MTYADDSICEEVFAHYTYAPEYPPTCCSALGSPSCPADLRGCRNGIAILALSQAPIVFSNDDLYVAVELGPGYHVVSWCEMNISL